MRAAEREATRQKLALIAIERLQRHLQDHHFPEPGVLYREVVRLSGFGREVRSSRLMMGAEANERLPVGAEMMFAGINRKVEVGIAVIRSHPCSIQSNPRDGCGLRLKLCVIFHEVDHSLATLRLDDWVLRLVGLNIKLDIGDTAAWSYGCPSGRALRQGSCCQDERGEKEHDRDRRLENGVELQ